MTRTKDLCHPETVRVAPSHQAEATKIAAELAAIAATGMVLPGSITQRRTRCGRPNCGCHADPPRLHGPYWQWTRKVAAKTDLPLAQRRPARRLPALDRQRPPPARTAHPARDPRRRRPRSRPPLGTLGRQDKRGHARLTCGRPASQAPSAQVSPKREDLSQFRGYLSLIRSRFVDRIPSRDSSVADHYISWQSTFTLLVSPLVTVTGPDALQSAVPPSYCGLCPETVYVPTGAGTENRPFAATVMPVDVSTRPVEGDLSA